MGRAPCCDKNGLKKGPWTAEEDQKLTDYIQQYGYGNWRTLPKNAGLQRCGKSCRLRWTNYLRPDIKRGRFTSEEEETIIQLHRILGNKWSAIASSLPGRTDNEIKNYWNTHIRKRLLRMGIDPLTHSPRIDLLDLSSILSSPLYGSSSQMNHNIQRLLGMQPVQVNPELLKLASSLIPTRENLSFCAQNGQENQPQIQNQIPDHDHFFQVQEVPAACTTLSTPYVDQNSSNFTDFGSEQHYSQLSDWQSNIGMASGSLAEEYYVPDQLPCYSYYSSDHHHPQSLMDPSLSETSTFQYSNNSNQNFSFASVLSTPSSSSPTPLNSNSTCINGSISSTEDERDSYGSCSHMLKFEIPNILDVNGFM